MQFAYHLPIGFEFGVIIVARGEHQTFGVHGGAWSERKAQLDAIFCGLLKQTRFFIGRLNLSRAGRFHSVGIDARLICRFPGRFQMKDRQKTV